MMVISVTYLHLQATKFLIRQGANTLQYGIKNLQDLNYTLPTKLLIRQGANTLQYCIKKIARFKLYTANKISHSPGRQYIAVLHKNCKI